MSDDPTDVNRREQRRRRRRRRRRKKKRRRRLRMKRRMLQYEQEILMAEFTFAFEEVLDDCPSKDVKDYQILSVFGGGSWGAMYRAKDERFYYAIKRCAKEEIRRAKRQKRAIREKRFMYAMHSPFVVDLFGKWKDASNIYFIIEYAYYGNLEQLRRSYSTKRIPEERTRQILTQVVLGMEYIHAANICHRDIRPGKIVIFYGGRVKITGFGTSVQGSAKLVNYLGASDYTPPEMLRSEFYTEAIDWWSLGVMMFQMLFEVHPFVSGDDADMSPSASDILRNEINERINDAGVSNEAKLLVRGLLEKDCIERLGTLEGGVVDVKSHPWFAKVNWYKVIFSPKQFFFERDEVARERETWCRADELRQFGPDEIDELREDLAEF